jgi:hypothetical protein
MSHQSPTHNPTPHDAEIDRALRLITHASPRPGLEGRILAHLKTAEPARRAGRWRFLFLPRMAFNALGAVAVASAVLYGTIEHGKHPGYRPAVQMAPAGGPMGAAEGQHVPTSPVQAPPTLHGRPGRPAARHGRASVPLQARKPSGVGVPKSPMVPSQQPADAPDQP